MYGLFRLLFLSIQRYPLYIEAAYNPSGDKIAWNGCPEALFFSPIQNYTNCVVAPMLLLFSSILTSLQLHSSNEVAMNLQ